MNEFNTREDFREHLSCLVGISSVCKFRNTEYLLTVNYGDTEESVIFTVTEAFNHLWVKELDFADFEEIRKTIGMQGKYQNYFEILRDALKQTSGNFKVDVANTHTLELSIVYKISKAATLIGSINMGESFQFENDKSMFRQFMKKVVFDLQESKQRESNKKDAEIRALQEKLAHAEGRVKDLDNRLPSSNDNSMSALFNADSSNANAAKRKPKTDLVAHNSKKRKPMGAKIGGAPLNFDFSQN